MINLHGLILADRSSRDLRELVMVRTSSSLPFAGRYRLIDFALSNLQNAGVRDVGVVMQRNYSSLLDHIGSGKEWDMSRKRGGLKLLPPFTGSGEYEGIIDALENVRGYIEDIKQDYVALMRGSLAASVDLADVMYKHVKSGADVTAVCTNYTPEGEHHRFIVGEDGFAKEIMLRRVGPGEGVATLEIYVMSKETLLGIIDRLRQRPQPQVPPRRPRRAPRRGRQDKRLYARGLCGRGAQRQRLFRGQHGYARPPEALRALPPRAAPCAPRAAATSPPTTARTPSAATASSPMAA